MSKTPQPRCNQQIRSQTVRLIDNHGEQHGEVDIKLAMSMAREAELDLVEVAPDAKPPVVKIMDQGRERYRQEKRERSQRKVRSHAHQLRLTPVIAEHDLDTKRRAAQKFLEKGDQVKLTVLMRGRQRAHPEMARKLIDRLVEELSEYGTPLRPPSNDAHAVQVTLISSSH